MRLYLIWEKHYSILVKNNPDENVFKAVKFILEKNIICGDALTLLRNDGNPLVFSEWSLVKGDILKGRDFELTDMLRGHNDQLDLFMSEWEDDSEIDALIPSPVCDFPPTNFKELGDNE